MFAFRSLTAKYVFIGLVLLSAIGSFVYITFSFTRHIKGEAARINLAGNLRYRAFELAWRGQQIVEEEIVDKGPLLNDFRKDINEFDEVISVLKNGDEARNINPIGYHSHDAETIFSKVVGEWQRDLKPVLLRIAVLDKSAPEAEARRTLSLYDQQVHEYVVDIDRIVRLLEFHTEKEIRDFDILRELFIAILMLVAVSIVLYMRRSITLPVRMLRTMSQEIDKGNFNAAVDVRSADEIGMLGKSFNLMASNLKQLISENRFHIQELDVLNRISAAASRSLSPELLLEGVMDEILQLGPLKLDKNGAIFLYDEKEQTIKLLVSRNFKDEQKSGCSVVSNGDCLCGIAAEKKEVIISESSTKDIRHSKVYSDAKEHGHIILPLKSRDKMLGVLCLYLPSGIELSEKEIELFTSIADIISVSLQNAINHRQVVMLAQSLESSNDVIVITDTEGRIIHINPETVRQFGYSQEELFGQNVTVIQSPHNPGSLGEEIFRETMRGGWSGEVINRRKDGTEYPVFLTTAPVKDENNTIIALIGTARDITERNRIEDILKSSEERLRSIINNAPAVIYLKDMEGRYMLVNNQWETLFNIGAENMIGKTDHDVFPKEIADSFRKNDDIVRKSGAPVIFEEAAPHADGLHTYISNKFVLKSSAGVPYAICGISTDITDRKQAQDELNERISHATLGAEIGVALTQGVDLRSILQLCTEAIVRHLGAAFARIWTLNEATDVLELQASAGMYTHIDGGHSRVPVGKFKIGLIAHERQPHLTNNVIGDPRVGDQEWARREGMVAFAGYPLIVGNRLNGVMAMFSKKPLSSSTMHALASIADGIALGIERKYSEEALKNYTSELLALAEASNVIITTPESIYEAVCHVAVVKFGLKSAWLGVIGKNQEINIVAGTDPEDNCLVRLKSGADSPAYDTCSIVTAMMTKTPQTINNLIQDPCPGPCEGKMALNRGYKSLMISPLINTNAELIGIIGYYSDVAGFFTPDKTKLLNVYSNQVAGLMENRQLIEELELKVKERTQQLEIARLQAEAANQAKSDFLANMSHELRTPLNSILGFSEIIMNGMAGHVNDEQKEFLNDINESGSHLLSLINDILDLSKVEAGKLELELGEVDIKDMIKGSLVMFREKAMKHGIKVSDEVEEGLPTFSADERKMRQVLYNLLSNAFKFTPDGGSVSVQALKVPGDRGLGIGEEKPTPKAQSQIPGGDLVEISIADTGIGISPEDQEKLFQPFQQIETSYTKKYAGTGLGLSLCKKFIELHGGMIWVESEPGKGSKFVIEIPFKISGGNNGQ